MAHDIISKVISSVIGTVVIYVLKKVIARIRRRLRRSALITGKTPDADNNMSVIFQVVVLIALAEGFSGVGSEMATIFSDNTTKQVFWATAHVMQIAFGTAMVWACMQVLSPVLTVEALMWLAVGRTLSAVAGLIATFMHEQVAKYAWGVANATHIIIAGIILWIFFTGRKKDNTPPRSSKPKPRDDHHAVP